MRRAATFATAWITTGFAGHAIAATAAREDTSGVFVWIFLGVCALIVVAQVVPAVMMMLGAAKGVAEAIKERRQVPVVEKKVKAR
jgi:hypothetical protein